MRQYLLFVLAFVCWLPAVPPLAFASGVGVQLKGVERNLDKGRKKNLELERKSGEIESDINRLTRESVAVAKSIQEHEADILWLESRIAALAIKEKKRNNSLDRSRDHFTNVLAALERLARRPPEALIAQPLSPSDTVRSAILLRSAVPMIETQAKNLRLELDELGRARNEMARRRAEMAAAVGAMTKQRSMMSELLARKGRLKMQTAIEREKTSKRITELAKQAKNLRDLLSRLKTKRRKFALKTPSLPSPSSKINRAAAPYPVVGKLTGLYGQAMGNGITRKGMVIKTRSGAQVVAPFAGHVVFAGYFRGYGQLLIIEHGGGYHSLLAGLGRIDGVMGQEVLAGEPVGVMGNADNGNLDLYIELRRNGKPVNPLPWLTANKVKASG